MGTVVGFFGGTDGKEAGGWKREVMIVFIQIAV